ncbi:MAG: enoyl-CoA hydratase/isomerase family protein [Alphaproteobacteria bacterium]|nr:enoyl-CoA hydratase/isomerase family protein [Alphaproteobacteria bacterium]MDE2340370.1 enoyl-CoA hydratase/isomerase family protein [Alphaproteobacteria bacterium]
MSELLARADGRIGHISLNKPQALHALGHQMALDMTAALLKWRDDQSVEAIILDHAEGRGFCAGGDIADLYGALTGGDQPRARRFFWDEYRLDHLIFTYPKPIVSFIDGVVMGGGVGISQPAKYRVATENTRFAMPETGIGLFPDVGGSWYLSRLPGRVGQFLVLTGARLDGAECLWAGLASHYLPAAALPEVKAQLAAHGASAIEAVLDAHAVEAPPPRISSNIEAINTYFAHDSLEGTLSALAGGTSDWCAKELAAVQGKCPLSCKVALEQLRRGKGMTAIADIFAMEYRLASRLIAHPNFAEGVRALIIAKDNAPQWAPARPEDVTQEMVDAVFAPLPQDKEWSPL